MPIKDLDEIPLRSKKIQEISQEAFKLPIPSTNFRTHLPNTHFLDSVNTPDISLTVHITTGDLEMKININPFAKLSEIRGIIARDYPESILSHQVFVSATGQQLEDEATLADCGLKGGPDSRINLKYTGKFKGEKHSRETLQKRMYELEQALREKDRILEQFRRQRHTSDSRYGGSSRDGSTTSPKTSLSNSNTVVRRISNESNSMAAAWKSMARGPSSVRGPGSREDSLPGAGGVPQRLRVTGAEEYNGMYVLQRDMWNGKPLYQKLNQEKCIRWFRNAWLIDDEVRDEPLGVAVWRKSTRHPGSKNQEWIVFKDNQWTDCSELRVTPVSEVR